MRFCEGSARGCSISHSAFADKHKWAHTDTWWPFCGMTQRWWFPNLLQCIQWCTSTHNQSHCTQQHKMRKNEEEYTFYMSCILQVMFISVFRNVQKWPRTCIWTCSVVLYITCITFQWPTYMTCIGYICLQMLFYSISATTDESLPLTRSQFSPFIKDNCRLSNKPMTSNKCRNMLSKKDRNKMWPTPEVDMASCYKFR